MLSGLRETLGRGNAVADLVAVHGAVDGRLDHRVQVNIGQLVGADRGAQTQVTDQVVIVQVVNGRGRHGRGHGRHVRGGRGRTGRTCRGRVVQDRCARGHVLLVAVRLLHHNAGCGRRHVRRARVVVKSRRVRGRHQRSGHYARLLGLLSLAGLFVGFALMLLLLLLLLRSLVFIFGDVLSTGGGRRSQTAREFIQIVRLDLRTGHVVVARVEILFILQKK